VTVNPHTHRLTVPSPLYVCNVKIIEVCCKFWRYGHVIRSFRYKLLQAKKIWPVFLNVYKLDIQCFVCQENKHLYWNHLNTMSIYKYNIYNYLNCFFFCFYYIVWFDQEPIYYEISVTYQQQVNIIVFLTSVNTRESQSSIIKSLTHTFYKPNIMETEFQTKMLISNYSA
jgi:hypothetical protein